MRRKRRMIRHPMSELSNARIAAEAYLATGGSDGLREVLQPDVYKRAITMAFVAGYFARKRHEKAHMTGDPPPLNYGA